ncbi:MAG: DNA gyrase inhibitor YacG [Nitrospiraceae bacterium]|nr:DNA gyrase inhibitor YacG [Nitrospiraceae bacterium]
MKIICPICKNQTTWEENPWRPFCCEKCKMIDLGKWVLEDYKIPDENIDGNSEEDEISENQQY